MTTAINEALSEPAYFAEVGDEGQIRHVLITDEERRCEIDAAIDRLSFSIHAADASLTR